VPVGDYQSVLSHGLLVTSSGGGDPPPEPTLAVSADGTVATISGSDPGATNTLEAARVTGYGSYDWTVEGSRVADGTVPMTLEPGQYFAKVTSETDGGTACSNLVFFRVGEPSGGLNHSPADIIAQVLVDLGQGTIAPDQPWPTAVSNEAQGGDRAITTYDTEIVKHSRAHVSGEVVEHFGVQVRVRAETHKVAFAKANLIARVLDEDVALTTTTIESSTYLVYSVSRRSGPLALGKDVPTSSRSVFTINVTVSLVKLT
jgi:hypothetical protein